MQDDKSRRQGLAQWASHRGSRADSGCNMQYAVRSVQYPATWGIALLVAAEGSLRGEVDDRRRYNRSPVE